MPNSIQGMQNQMFAIFMLLVIFTNIVEGMMPNFVVARALYEVRERPSKAYSWQAFMLASISVEMVWNMAMAVPVYFTWYYPIGLYRNAPGAEIERGGTMFLIILVFLMLTSSFSSMIIAGMEVAESASNVAQVMFSLCLIFNGYVLPCSGYSCRAQVRLLICFLASFRVPRSCRSSGRGCIMCHHSPTWCRPFSPWVSMGTMSCAPPLKSCRCRPRWDRLVPPTWTPTSRRIGRTS